MEQKTLSRYPLLLWSFSAILAVCVCSIDLGKRKCTVPSVERGQTAHFTCAFGVNMLREDLRKDVIIQHEKNGAFREILDCYWVKDKYTCKLKIPRYFFNYKITESLSLMIPSASEEDEGTYYCRIPGIGHEGQTCNFTLKAPQTPADAQESPESTSPWSAPRLPAVKSGQGKSGKVRTHPPTDEDNGSNVQLALFLIFMVLSFLLAAVIVALIIYPAKATRLRAWFRRCCPVCCRQEIPDKPPAEVVPFFGLFEDAYTQTVYITADKSTQSADEGTPMETPHGYHRLRD